MLFFLLSAALVSAWEPRGISSIQTESVSDLNNTQILPALIEWSETHLLGRGEPRTLFLISSMMRVGRGLGEGTTSPSWQWLHLKEVPAWPPAPLMSPP